MKCKYCNATNLTLEDEFCPYCGALNEAARKHIEDMRLYNQRFDATETEVKKNVSNQIKIHTQIIMIVILVVINLIVLFANINMYEIAYTIDEIRIKSNATQHIEKLREYEANEEFLLLNKYYSRHNLYIIKEASEFDSLSDMIYQYERIMKNIYYLENEGVASYYTEDELVEEVSGSVANYYSAWENKNNEYYNEQFSEEHLKAMYTLKDRVESLLMNHCKLSEDEIKSLPTMREAQITMLIGRGFGLYE